MSQPAAGFNTCRAQADFAGMLRCYRRLRLLTQEELAERSGRTVEAISSLETGVRRRPHLSTVRALAEALALDEPDRQALARVARASGVAVPEPVLPLPAHPFIGRETSVREVAARLLEPETRLLTLTGPGGIGKTRLALRVASEPAVAAAFPDGVAFVDLSGVLHAELVPAAVAQALGLRASAGLSIDEALLDHCAGRTLLLVLDNLEHLLGAARMVDDLLARAPGVTVLATSRERLALARERRYAVEPMSLPAAETREMASLLASEAVRLFVLRAERARSGFAIDDQNGADIAAICIGLDGIPLAIELAAARIAHVGSPAHLRQRLDRSLGWLTTGQRDQTQRHRAMRDAIAWTYDTLASGEQALFRRLAVFAGGFTIDTAERNVDPADAGDAIDLLAALVERSLLQLYDGPDGGTRYRMLQPIRAFGLEQLEAAGAGADARARHGAIYLELVERGEQELTGPLQAEWMRRLEAEHDNIRAALDWAITAPAPEPALRMAGALWRFWAASGRLQEGRDWLERAVALDADVPPEVRAKALRRLGNMCVEVADYRAAEIHFTASLAAARMLGDQAVIGRALVNLGWVALHQGAYEGAQAHLNGALLLLDGADVKHDRASGEQALGAVAFATWRFADAERHYATSHQLRDELGDEIGCAYSSAWLGQLDRVRGRHDEAESRLTRALIVFQAGGDRLGEALVGLELGLLAWARGGRAQALTRVRQSLELRMAAGAVQEIIESVEAVAVLGLDAGNIEQTVPLLESASAWRARHRVELFPPLKAAFAEALHAARGSQEPTAGPPAAGFAQSIRVTALAEQARALAAGKHAAPSG